MLVYHGSPNIFNQFDYSKIRENGTSEGIGFYFTDSQRIATGYANNGYLYHVNLATEKALSDKEKTISKNELKTLIIALQEHEDFLSNYGDIEYEGFGNVLQQALNNEYDYAMTDTEIMGSLYNALGENEIVIKLFYEVLGYDHIVSVPEWGGDQKLFIALTNDIINIQKVEKL